MGKRKGRRRRFHCCHCKRVFAIGEPFRLEVFKDGSVAFACFDGEGCRRRTAHLKECTK